MLRIVKAVLVVALAWVLCPGLAEVTENLWHVATTGHLAHALEAGDGHAPAGDEHGCSGTFHLCTCCQSTPAQAASPPVAKAVAGMRKATGVHASVRHVPPHLPGLFRPPRA